jgi:hypothetical protein
MNQSRTITVSIALLAVSVFAMPVVRAQDMVKVAPKNCKVLLDNDRVRVIRVVSKPGEKMEMHSHPAHIAWSCGKRMGDTHVLSCQPAGFRIAMHLAVLRIDSSSPTV